MPAVSILMPLKAKKDRHVGWAHEAITSVMDQTVRDWELILIDDGSEVDISLLKDLFNDKRLHGARATGQGVCDARNQAAELAKSPLLLGVDADDLLPKNALTRYLSGWKNGGSEKGIVYTDLLLFGKDGQRHYRAGEYNFRRLMNATFMTIGCLHRKSDWRKIGGWKKEMSAGLEDWEYWISMGEAGVCGFYVPEELYHYRRRADGRLATLRSTENAFDLAVQRVRELHNDSFNGRYPVTCCGRGGGGQPPRRAGGQAPQRMVMQSLPTDALVDIIYTGRGQGFYVTGKISQLSYYINGPNMPVVMKDGREGVDPRDVQFLLKLGRGRDFKRG